MCLSKCGRPGVLRSHGNSNSNALCGASAPLRVERYYQPCIGNKSSIWTSAHSFGADDEELAINKQTFARREKSRIAAKLRRLKENQTLMRLRLILPIQSYKNDESVTHKLDNCIQYSDSDGATTPYDSVVRCDSPSLCTLPVLKQPLLAPEFEKAVTIRLASCALCLYNWLYSQELLGRRLLSTSLNCSSTSDSDLVTFSLSRSRMNSFANSLSLFSQSLLLIVVDVVENVVVFAPPSYSRLIGLRWCTTIGLKLPELRTRQCAAAASTSTGSALLRSNRFHTSKPCSASTSLKKELNATTSSLQSEEHFANTPSSPLPCDLTVTLPIVDPTVQYAPRTSSPTPSMWTVAPRDRSIKLTTLLPPDQEGPSGRRCMKTCSLCSCTISHLNGASPDACSCLSDTYAVCWASQSLSSQYPDTLASHDDRNSDHSASRCDSSPLPNTSPTSHSHSSLRVFLFNPIMLSTSLSEMASPYAADLFHTNTAYTDESRHENFVDLAHSPRTYHLLHNLHFVGVHPRFLSVLNYSPADVIGRNLLDLIHPDDLVSVAETLESVTEAKPMITTLHRLRCNSGGYRWSRLLAYVTTKTGDFRRPSAFAVDAEFPYNHEKTQVLVSKTSRPNSRSRPVISKPVSQITSYLDSRPPSPTYVPGCAAVGHLPPKSSATCCQNNVDASPNTWILVCCHQFVHISTDTSPLNATFAITDAPTHEYHQVDASHLESHRPLKRRASLPTPSPWDDYAQLLDSRDVHDSTAAYVPPLPHKSDQLDDSGPNEYTDFYRSHTSGQVTDPLCTLDNLDDELNGLTDVGARTWDRTEAHSMETNMAWPVDSSFGFPNASMTKSGHPEASHVNKKDWVKQAPSVVPTLGDWNEINAPSGFRGPNSCAMIGASPANPNKTTFASNSEWSLSRSISSCGSHCGPEESDHLLTQISSDFTTSSYDSPLSIDSAFHSQSPLQQTSHLLPQAEILPVPDEFALDPVGFVLTPRGWVPRFIHRE